MYKRRPINKALYIIFNVKTMKALNLTFDHYSECKPSAYFVEAANYHSSIIAPRAFVIVGNVAYH